MKGMKKLTALVLAVLLIASVSAPALAAPEDSSEALDSRLAAVTVLVKKQLGITSEYTEFYGYLTQENENPLWSLNWSTDNKSVNVTAGEDGTVYYVYYYEYNDYYRYDPYFAPIFPEATREEAQAVAESYASNLLRANESVVFRKNDVQPLSGSDGYFYGTLLVNGLETPQSVSVNVRMSDLRVMSFSRSDSSGVIKNGYPSPDTSITASQAAKTITAKYEFEPRYILVEGSTARVVYVPSTDGTWVVDAKTGEAFNLDGAYRYIDKAAGAAPGASEAADTENDLTPAELEGISKLEGALTSDKLDAIVRANNVFGVNSDFELIYTGYYLDNATGEITAYVRYAETVKNPSKYGVDKSEWDKALADGYTPTVYKYFTLDGKTGELDSVSTSYSGFGWEGKDREAGSVPTAVSDYLAGKYGEKFAASELSHSNGYSYGVKTDSFTYSQKVNGYYYYGNQISITVCVSTGSIDNLWANWDDTVEFAPANVTVTPEQAADVYAAALETELCYRISSYTYDDYWNSYYEMMLAWAPGYEGFINGIDAETGELLKDIYEAQDMSIQYTDISRSFAKKEIEALAKYGVGFYADEFKPYAGLTQKDLVIFLLSAGGYTIEYDTVTEEDLEWIYSSAESLGILKRSQREPERKITRAELCRILITMSGYGKAAELPGIYICGFSDDALISDSDYGYVAIAKGLGIIKGDLAGAFKPYNTVTRQEAAVMLYRFMDRPHEPTSGNFYPVKPMPVDDAIG